MIGDLIKHKQSLTSKPMPLIFLGYDKDYTNAHGRVAIVLCANKIVRYKEKFLDIIQKGRNDTKI